MDPQVDLSLRAFDRSRADLLDRLTQTRHAWSELDAEDGLVAADLRRLEHRLRSGTVAIGVFGLIKRGKSTLVNALLATAVSPTGATPETAVPVTIRHGRRSHGVVHLADGTTHDVEPDDLRYWTSQRDNHGNHRGVAHLDWRVDAPFLRPGVTLLDTPGLDDVDTTYTTRTLQQLERVDAGLVVISSPPTIGAGELAHLRTLHERHGERIVVACNIHEQHADDPEVVEAVLEYVRRHVTRVCPDAEVIRVCATRAWQARAEGDEQAWEASGGAELQRALESVAATMAGERLVAAVERDLDAVVATAEQQVRSWTTAPEEPSAVRRDPWTHAAGVLAQVEDARLQAHLAVRGLFDDARTRLGGVHDERRLQGRIEEFAREVDTCLFQAQARVADRLADLAAELDLHVDAQARPVGFTPPEFDTPEDGPKGRFGGVAGGIGLAAAGLVLGPLGMVGGAVIGWRLGDLARSEVKTTTSRRRVVERLQQIRDEVLADLDEQLRIRVDLTRRAAMERRDATRRDAERQRAEAEHLDDVLARLRTLAGAPPVPDLDEVPVAG